MNYDCKIIDSKNKRKHITLTIQEKLEIIDLVESGISRQSIANRFGIGKTTVHDIHRRKDIIKNFALQNTSELSKRRRVDIKLDAKPDGQFIFKDESNGIVEEETLVENFNQEEFDYNDEGYEIVYEPILCSNEIPSKSLIELPTKLDCENNSKRKSKTLTLKEKYDILMQLDVGTSVSTIINEYGIGRTTLYDLKKQKQKIFEYIENSNGENRRTFKKSNYPEIENKLLAWCNSRDFYTEKSFYEKYKQLFLRLKKQNAVIQSPFSGSKSWCKRFFERNPEYKKKLIMSKNLIDTFKYEHKSSDVDKSFDDSILISNDVEETSPIRRKFEVIDDEYEIFKKEIPHSGDEKAEMEKKLLDWCLNQNSFPNYSLISDKAYNLFVSMDLKGDFNPTFSWAKTFVDRHSDIIRRLRKHRKSLSDDDSIENMHEESLEYIESDFIKLEPAKLNKNEQDDYGNEYIIEELDDDDISEMEVASYEEHKESGKEKEEFVADEDAMKSLKILIKYSEQKGHDEISSLLVEYRHILLQDESLL